MSQDQKVVDIEKFRPAGARQAPTITPQRANTQSFWPGEKYPYHPIWIDEIGELEPDDHVAESNGDAMADPTREEFQARLETVEARAETRFVELSMKIDRVIDAVARANTDLNSASSELRSEMREVKGDNKNTRSTIVVTMILALLAALGALWLTQGNLLAAFQASIAVHDSNSQPGGAPKEPTPTPAH